MGMFAAVYYCLSMLCCPGCAHAPLCPQGMSYYIVTAGKMSFPIFVQHGTVMLMQVTQSAIGCRSFSLEFELSVVITFDVPAAKQSYQLESQTPKPWVLLVGDKNNRLTWCCWEHF